ncbi:hypothetical protein ACFYY2_12105 [Streptomyces sp. NPDC001822]|uniref:hypothetical protein n=1 Tax=Streptomyces sp. NPDC001822 TaxID=3364614 RepID=UPI0036BFD707
METQIPAWHSTVGYPQLGKGPDYRGYVVKVQGTDDGHPERWFTYAFDQDARHTYWIGMTDSADEAKAVLERLLKDGWICEHYIGDDAGHCSDRAMTVRSTWDEGRTKKFRVLLCEAHRNILPDWDRMTIGQYVRTFSGLEQDEPIKGARK